MIIIIIVITTELTKFNFRLMNPPTYLISYQQKNGRGLFFPISSPWGGLWSCWDLFCLNINPPRLFKSLLDLNPPQLSEKNIYSIHHKKYIWSTPKIFWIWLAILKGKVDVHPAWYSLHTSANILDLDKFMFTYRHPYIYLFRLMPNLAIFKQLNMTIRYETNPYKGP